MTSASKMQRIRLACLCIQEHVCFYCCKEPAICTLDHFYPIRAIRDHLSSKYSPRKTYKNNSVAACEKCNVRKGGRLPTMTEVVKYQKLYGRTPKFFYTIGVSDLNATP